VSTGWMMSKALSILLISIIGLYSALCATLFLRAGVDYLGRGWRRVPATNRRVSSNEFLTPRRRAWTRAVWRGTPAH
jgi:hypothetical protein